MTPPPADRALFDLALDLARRGGDLTLKWFRSEQLAVVKKSDGSPVTEADRTSERFIRSELERLRPADAILGEEEAERAGTSGVQWIIDPLDGTRAFTRGVPLYATLVAVSDQHGPAVGVIHLPALAETVYAGRGLGCFLNGKVARVSETDTLAGACLTTSGFEHWPEGDLGRVRKAGLALRTWGDAYGYALVATGRADVMVDPVIAIWDVAPMPVIMSEAGGSFTDYTGAVRADGGNGIAANLRLHQQVRALLEGS